MLLQSDQRYSDKPGGPEDSYLIDRLPALPALWSEGSMHGLRARGGFEVDLDWNAGRLSAATIRSVGGTTARLRYAGTTIPIQIVPGQQLRVTAPGGVLHVVVGNAVAVENGHPFTLDGEGAEQRPPLLIS